jgi:DNA polymerase
MKAGKPLPGSVLQVLKSMLRPAICPGKGRVIVRGDWNAVEARALPWLTGRDSALDYMDAFKVTDKANDVYVQQARAAGLGENRQAGKVVVLALGYGGAAGALSAMCRGYGVVIEDKEIVVRRWRAANRWAVDWWYELDRVALAVVRSRSTGRSRAGRVEFSHSRPTAMPALLMHLPSGRTISYPYPKIEIGKFDNPVFSYLKSAWKPKSDATSWPRAQAWHGLLAENATQAVCADLLRDAIVAGMKAKLPLIGHVHDEIVAECKTGEAKRLAKSIEKIMLTSSDWARGLSLAVEIDISPRFRK